MKAQKILYVFYSYNNTPNWVFSPKNQKKKKNSMYNITNSVFKPRKFSMDNIKIQHVIHSNNHIENSTKCHFHGPKQGNNQRGKIPHLLKCVGPVLDPHKSENNGGKASSSLSPFFLSSCFLFFLSFFLSFFSFFSSCLQIVCNLSSNYQVGLT